MFCQIDGLFRHRAFLIIECFRLVTRFVLLNDFPSSLSTNGHQIDRHALIHGVGDATAQDVRFEMEIGGIERFERYVALRKRLMCFLVSVELIVQAALEFSALSSQFLWIGGKILLTRSTRRHRLKIFSPRCAAQFSAAGSDTSDACRFLSGTNLFHFDAYMEGVCQNANQFAKVNALISNVIENCFVAIALIFHITDFHVQFEFFGYLSALNHGGIFTTARLFPFFNVGGARFAVDAFQVCTWLKLRLFHLQWHQTSSKGHCANVMPWRGFHSYDVAFGKVELIIIEEISFSCILKLHFYEVRHLVVARNVAVIVERIELMLGASTTASRKSSESRV